MWKETGFDQPVSSGPPAPAVPAKPHPTGLSGSTFQTNPTASMLAVGTT